MAKQLSLEVQRVSEILRGRSVLMIGGEARLNAHKALEDALGVKDVIWLATNKHDSFKSFEPYVVRQDVAVVLLLLRWASHSFGNVADICRRYGKPLVRLPGGYGPNQVAMQILAQSGERLRRSA